MSAPFPAYTDGAAPIRVDVKTDAATMERLFRRVERCWNTQGRTEPFWSVLSHDRYKRANFDSNAAEFWDTGPGEVQRMDAWLSRNGVDTAQFESCLELGCGVGRVTPWLARRFRTVTACDISPPHMELAKVEVANQRLDNVEFVLIDRLRAFDALPEVDAVYSVIVLQHNPPPVIREILRRVLRRLRPGGVAFFQVPTHAEGYQFDVQEYLTRPEHLEIEMHVIPQREIFDLAEASDCSVLEVEPDWCVGTPGWMSHTFLVRKQRPGFLRRLLR
jgi:SAM-dependent methyltransferase